MSPAKLFTSSRACPINPVYCWGSHIQLCLSCSSEPVCRWACHVLLSLSSLRLSPSELVRSCWTCHVQVSLSAAEPVITNWVCLQLSQSQTEPVSSRACHVQFHLSCPVEPVLSSWSLHVQLSLSCPGEPVSSLACHVHLRQYQA